MVLVNDQYPGEFVHSVMIANEDGSRAATEYLIELGHRRIAYVGDRSGYQTETERLEGYRQALNRHESSSMRHWRCTATDGPGSLPKR